MTEIRVSPGGRRGVRELITPARVHLSSLALGFIALLVLGRGQWFAYDDWAILHSDYSVLASHQGHWTTIATLLFQLLRATVGLHSYLPYLALALVAHLAVVHLIWRICLRAGVPPWWATGFAAIGVLLGCGAENLFWAFQVGYMGAIAMGLLVVLLLDRATLSVRTSVLTAIAAVVALPFSGTALPVLAGAAALGWIRHGFRRTILILAPSAAVYLVWYLMFARNEDNGLGLHGVALLTHLPVFMAVMFAAAYGQFVGILVLGPVVALALLLWLFFARKRWLGREAVAYVLLVASVVFSILTSISRGGGALTAAGSERYAYVIVMLSLPTMALAVVSVARRGRLVRAIGIVLLLAVGAVNTALTVMRADEQAKIEQATERQYSAAAALIALDPGKYSLDQRPLPAVAPDVTLGDIREEVRDHLVTLVQYFPADTRKVENALGR